MDRAEWETDRGREGDRERIVEREMSETESEKREERETE